MDGPRLSLVLPAFNEEAGLRQAIAEADEALARLCADYEVLVVDDGSRDGTAAVAADEAGRRPCVRLLRHPVNRGYGAALRTGFEAARFDLVAFTDADCQFHLDDLTLLLARIERADVVVGYRLHRQDTRRRRFLSRGYNLLARTLLGTGVRDVDCALKLFRRDTLARLLPESPGFFVNTEMLTRARQLGLAVAEVGVRHRPRLRGRSTVSLREVPRTLGHLVPFWWSRVVFAGPLAGASGFPEGASVRQEARSASEGIFRGVLALLLVLLVAGSLFFSRLRAPLLEPQEGRYAEIGRQMLAEGRWLVPTLHGEPYLDKPPLLYWAVMASYRTFGVHDWAARVVPGLAGVLTALVVFAWGWRVLGLRAGACAALVLCLMPEFIYRGRMLTFDVLLGLCVVTALAAAHLAVATGRLRWGWWLTSALACGAGLLTKGPVALVLVAVPVFAVGLLDPRFARLGRRGWAVYLCVALSVAAPWCAAVCWQLPDFAGHFFWKHNVVRFVTPFDHARPAWFYLPGLLLGLLPWLPLFPALAARLADRSGAAAVDRPAALGFVLLGAVWILLFFSAAGCKRPSYLLPAFGPLALALGWLLTRPAPAPGGLWRSGTALASASAGLTLGAGVVAALGATAAGMVAATEGYALAAAGLVALLLLLVARVRLSWAATAAVVFAVLLAGVRELLPGYNDQFSLRGQLRRQAKAADVGSRPVVCYPQRFECVSFYLPHSRVLTFGPTQKQELIAHLQAHPDTLLLVKSGRVLDELVAHLPPSVEFVRGPKGMAVTVGRVADATGKGRPRPGEVQ